MWGGISHGKIQWFVKTMPQTFFYEDFPVPWFNIKMPSCQYRKSHCGDKTVIRSSYLHHGISYTGKMISLYWIRALVFKLFPLCFDVYSILLLLPITVSDTLTRLRQNGQHFADDTLKCFYWHENVPLSVEISLKFVPRRLALFQIMAWCLSGTKPLSETLMT